MSGEARLRIDKWLWHARFFKTRTLAAKLVGDGKVRVNAERVTKPASNVQPGDVLTFPQARTVRVVRILALGQRRGPASEAQTLYEDIAPAQASQPRPVPAPRYEGKGRPTKKDRRALEK